MAPERVTVPTPDGEALAAWVVGPAEAEPVLLIAGAASDSRAWRYVVPQLCATEADRLQASGRESLAARHRVAGYDQRGTGSSSGVTVPDSAGLAAEHALAVGAALLGPRFHVVGHSLGGMAALRLVLARPDRVASLVLMSTSAGGAGLTPPDPEFLAHMTGQDATSPEERARRSLVISTGSRFRAEHRDLVERLVAESAARPPDPPESAAAQASAFLTHDVGADLHRIGAPTLVLCGDEDRVIPPPNSRYLAAHIPGARLAVLPGVGHALDLEAAGAIVEQVAAHVSAHPSLPHPGHPSSSMDR